MVAIPTDQEVVERLKKRISPEIHAQYSNEGELYYLDLSGLGLKQLPAEVCQLKRLEVLYLSENRLTALPAEIGQLKRLQELSLFGNNLEELPAEIGELGELQELALHKNRLTTLHPEVGRLIYLRKLSLYENQLRELPQELGGLLHLQKLYLDNNKLATLPAALGELRSLQELYLYKNMLRQLPAELGTLTQLQKLSLYENQLTHLPTELGQLADLQKLYLDNNKLTQLPAELGKLKSLRELSLSGNPLTRLPLELGRLEQLQVLSLLDCPKLTTPPPEIVNQGTQATLTFLQELQQPVERYEVKLLIVGEAVNGKTSLLRALQGKDFITTLSSTHGIDVNVLSLPHPTDPSVTVSLNTWDFGGQQIYHATHQFFLTRRSLYLVVWNARAGAEQGKLDYWLNIIQSLAPDAPVLLIATHSDERNPELNYQFYKKAYPQLVGAVSVSNKKNTGIAELKRLIAEQAIAMPLVGQPWPRNWIEVEGDLKEHEEHHIDAKSYRQICEAHGVQAQVAQGTLGSYLHDLGKILYFPQDFVLSNMIVLKPNWVTKAISYVLEDKGVRAAQGILQHSQLSRIWANDEEGGAYEPYLYPAFLRLMERFDLSYQIEPPVPGAHPTHSLVPQLLPFQPPADLPAWPRLPKQGQTQLEMIYRFDFLPGGIMSWFIVRTHRYTLGKHWREGVLLSYQQHEARVELNPLLRELHLLVWGVQPHNFFTILKDTIEVILERFQGLNVRRDVPCICHWQTDSTVPCPNSYRYDSLIKQMQAGRTEIECWESLERVSLADLLYGIHRSTAPKVQSFIDENKEELLQHLQQLEQNQAKQLRTEELILQQMKVNTQLVQETNLLAQETNQMIEWSVRNFMRLWNNQMRYMEAEAPNAFIIEKVSKSRFLPKSWVNETYKLHLMCQYPSQPHCIAGEPGYELQRPREWWKQVSPWLKHLVTFLKYGLPLAGVASPALEILNGNTLEAELDLLKQISEDLFENMDEDMLSMGRQEQDIDAAALRVLYNFLKEIDPQQHWAGLRKVRTPDGNVLWLCAEHAQEYEAPLLQLENGKARTPRLLPPS